MYFNDVEKELIEKGLDALKEKLENKRPIFEIGTLERERNLENKLEAIYKLKNNLYKSDFTSMEKTVIFEALDGLKETLIGNRSLFDVGSVQREQLETNLERIANIKNNINGPISMGSLESKIDAAKQQVNQPVKHAPQRNNDLEL